MGNPVFVPADSGSRGSVVPGLVPLSATASFFFGDVGMNSLQRGPAAPVDKTDKQIALTNA